MSQRNRGFYKLFLQNVSKGVRHRPLVGNVCWVTRIKDRGHYMYRLYLPEVGDGVRQRPLGGDVCWVTRIMVSLKLDII